MYEINDNAHPYIDENELSTILPKDNYICIFFNIAHYFIELKTMRRESLSGYKFVETDNILYLLKDFG